MPVKPSMSCPYISQKNNLMRRKNKFRTYQKECNLFVTDGMETTVIIKCGNKK